MTLPPTPHDLETTMIKVARDLAIGIYDLPTILKNNSVNVNDFDVWKLNPRFLDLLRSEREAWGAAGNTADRTKLKAAVIMEEFMVEAYAGLHDRKIALNHRVELGKLVARIAGMGETRALNGAGGAAFSLNINIGPGVAPITIRPEIHTIDHDDGYDPFTSPNTLED